MNKIFKALSDKTRRQILAMLRDGELTAGEIADQFSITKPSITHHLNILHRAELVSREKEGQYIYYSLNTTVLQDALNWFLDFTGIDKEDNNENQKPGL